jgi:Helix-hairpin-helix motif
LNRVCLLAASLILCAVTGRRLGDALAPAPVPPGCAHRVLLDDGISSILGCSQAGEDGDRIKLEAAPSAGGVVTRMAGPALRLLDLPVDLNRSSVEDLQALPGVGPKLAQRIAAARPFLCPSDLRQVEGIGPKRWIDLRGAVTVDPHRRRLCADHL